MKKLMVIITTMFLIASISACAPMGAKEGVKVKCPACGHEFTPPHGGPA
jgi:hypothetical protein